MTERTRISNGRFQNDLNNWDVSGAVYSAGDGDGHYGVAVLETGGDYIEQDFSVPDARTYTLFCAVKAAGSDLSGSQATIRIVDGDGNTVITINLSGTADTWTDNTNSVGLIPGTTYTIRFTNASAAGDVKIDDAWLWFVPITRANLAAKVNRKLARLASERSLSITASGAQTEGDYTDAVETGLRTVGAINPETGEPDIRYLDPDDVQTCLDMIEREMLEYLENDYSVLVDTTVGPERQNLSQISQRIGEKLGTTGQQGGGGGASRVIQRRISYD